MTRPVASNLPETRRIGPITQTDIVRFAGAGGDFNPLHHDQETAARAGFPRPIAMGQMTAGMAAAWITDWCGIENLRELKVRFVAAVSIGDTIEFTATVEPDSNDSSHSTVALQASVDERPVLSGTATVRRSA